MNKNKIQWWMGGGVNLNAIPNQKAIWDFSSVANVSTSSGNLDGATDLSGTGNNVTLSASKPTYTSSGGQNNKGFINIGASGDFVKTGITGITTSPFTVYMVIQLPGVYTANSVLAEYDTGLKGLLARDVTKGFMEKATPTIYTQYNEPGIATFDGANLGYGEACAPARRSSVMVIRYSVLKTIALTNGGNDGMILRVNNEPFIDYSGVATAGTQSVTKFSCRYPNAKVYEIRLVSGIPTYDNDLAMTTGLMSKYAISQPAKTLICLGDSHTAGTQTGTAGTPFMQQVMDNGKANVYNYAVGGFYIHGSGAYSLETFYPTFNKAIFNGSSIFMCYGTNDAQNMNGYNLATWKASYKAIVNALIATGYSPSKIILATPPWSTGTYVAGAGIAFSTICQTVRDIASETGTVLCDFAQAHINASQDCNTVVGTADHIHMDGAMHTTCYNTLWPLIA